jgi:transcriptional regulator with XRE-family HTH domain
MISGQSPLGSRLRYWRERQNMTQAELAFEAGVSTRHLSFVETGRASASRDLVLTLAKRLDLPSGDRNALLLSAGFAPVFESRPLDDPSFQAALILINEVLRAHEPNPALAFDRQWNLVAANRIVSLLLDGVAPKLLEPPLNLLRLTLHPEGLSTRIDNFAHWRERMLTRLHRRQLETGDQHLSELYAELSGYLTSESPSRTGEHQTRTREPPTREQTASPIVAVPFRLKSAAGPLAFLSTTMIFGTAPDNIEVSGIAIETFLPADAATAATLRRLAGDTTR